ncbi:ATP-binding protein [Vibrio parahaemolyticus]|uniref:AAA family ATPase n=1 Tax=Vibrio parahaemolyticus TaxID=670 RepID=UPI001A1DFBF7|nr:ATP-binding protein [Vibrio parahaemolyticus]EJG0663255.1 ATP-binding protein [Vibrio parahaemolyticus]ELB2174038.1 ATP-binding protein [Vibrio parahaemolyticus]MCR9953322.1 ATP-binding protein [Vibrio parahaemolyticus]HAS6834628.1 AAA family ATPase [Vibrio parahaemolyticus]
MLLTFSVQNYKGIGERQELNFIASTKNEFPKTLYEVNESLKVNGGLCLVGANGVGKSHLLQSLRFFHSFIARGENLNMLETFLLSDKWNGKPTEFEALYYCDALKEFLSYDLTLLNGKVVSENLVSRKNRKGSKNKVVFEREGNTVKLGRDIKVSEEMISATIDSGASLIKFSSGINIPQLKSVHKIANATLLFTPDLVQDLGHALVSELVGGSRLNAAENEEEKETLLISCNKRLKICKDIINAFDVPINKIELVDFDNGKYEIFITPERIGDNGFKFSLEQAQGFYSTGTFNLIIMTMLIMGMSTFGHILLLDEIDGSFHHRLTLAIIDLMRTASDEKMSQFIISTHDIMVIDHSFRRDAILTVTKDKNLETVVSRMSDYSVRKDAKLSMKYLSNEFGNLPKIMRKNFDE